MLMPGFGSPRVPVNVRVFLAVSVTLALAPVLVPVLEADLSKVSAVVMAQLVCRKRWSAASSASWGASS